MQDHKRILPVFVCTMGLLSHQDLPARPNSAAVYVRHRPEATLLYQLVNEYWPEFQAELASQDKYLPAYITREFEAYLKCGRLEHGFLRVRCKNCHDERLVAFSGKRRGFYASYGARRMADSAALLVDEILPQSRKFSVLGAPLMQIFTSTCCFWTVFISTAPMDPMRGFAGSRRQPVMNSPI